jgi:membrane protein required for colicin V production
MDVMPMAAFDFVFVVILVICAIRGYMRGGSQELFPLAVWIIAIALSFYYHQPFADAYLSDFFEPVTAMIVAEVILVLIVLLLGKVCSYGLAVLLLAGHPSASSRFFGILLGLVKGLIICLLLAHVISHTGLAHKDGWSKSALVQKLSPMLDKLDSSMSDKQTISYDAVPKMKGV